MFPTHPSSHMDHPASDRMLADILRKSQVKGHMLLKPDMNLVAFQEVAEAFFPAIDILELRRRGRPQQ